MNCAHENFIADVKVTRINKKENGNIENLMVDVRVICSNCKNPLTFKGLQGGLNFDFPTVSADGQEARLPAKIQDEILTVNCN